MLLPYCMQVRTSAVGEVRTSQVPAQGRSYRQGKLLKKTMSAWAGSCTPHSTDG